MGPALEKIKGKLKIICLHGFLGQSSDWDLVKSYFMVSPLAHQFEWWAVDYMKAPELGPQNDFTQWSRNFNIQVRRKFPEGPCVLVGYSLGGRLALQALQAAPELYEKAIFISTNPGLLRDKEKEERSQSDLRWSQKFLEMPWLDLQREWNDQGVFKGSVGEPQRREVDYDRRSLAEALGKWSLARQEDFRGVVAEQAAKILWVAGEKDIKFASIAMDLKKRAPVLQTQIFPKSAHRVLFDQPGELAQAMIEFLD